MRIILFFLISCFLATNLLAQERFSEIYDFGGIGASFKNILLVEDTLILIGNYRNSSATPWEVLFAKIDTAGNILDFKTHNNKYGDHFIFFFNVGFIKTTDGGYITLPRLSSRDNPTLMKFDIRGEMSFIKEYESENYKYFQKVIEIEDGYLLGGHTLIPDVGYNFIIAKTDLSGEIIWERVYEISSHNELLSSFIQTGGNTFVIGGGISSRGVPQVNSWAKNIIFAIDSLGEEKWRWEGPLNEETFVSGLNQSADGGWVYGTGTYENYGFGSKQKIVKRDADFNLLWEQRLNVYDDSSRDAVIDVKPTPDGNWVACGKYLWPDPHPDSLIWDPENPPPTEVYSWLNGFLHQVSDSDDSLWSMRDTVFFFSTIHGLWNYLNGLVVLPSGSVIAVGYTNQYEPIARSWAWLLKVDKNGCLDTLCTITGIEDFLIPPEEVNIFPNPVYDEIRIDFEGNYAIEIYDTYGRLVKREKKLNGLSSIKLTGMASGAYFVKIYSSRGVLTKKIIKTE